ncbi:MAG: RHS repeat-associated core domain-containing protein [Vulcanimicrobiota bacterium]
MNEGLSNTAQPSLGRFLNRDPIGFAGGLNLFSAMDNNPTTYVDPTGLLLESATYGGHVDGSRSADGSGYNFRIGVSAVGAAAVAPFIAAQAGPALLSSFLANPAQATATFGISLELFLGSVTGGDAGPRPNVAAFLKPVAAIRTTQFPKSPVQASRVPCGKMAKTGEQYTKAGRDYTKHAEGQRRIHDYLPPLTGTISDHNRMGEQLVTEILENPTSVWFGKHNTLLDISAGSGRTARFKPSNDGGFVMTGFR